MRAECFEDISVLKSLAENYNINTDEFKRLNIKLDSNLIFNSSIKIERQIQELGSAKIYGVPIILENYDKIELENWERLLDDK